MLSKVVGDDFNLLNGYRLIDYRGGKSINSWDLVMKGEIKKILVKDKNVILSNPYYFNPV